MRNFFRALSTISLLVMVVEMMIPLEDSSEFRSLKIITGAFSSEKELGVLEAEATAP